MSIAGPNEPHSAPTLSAVAKLAGVSSITVSRVMRLPNLVAPKTRGRVEAAMRELGYVPNQVAGALASSRTNSVGVLVPTIANSIFADTVQGLSDELEPLGYAVILAQSRYDAAREDHMLGALLSWRPEAIVMVGSPATEDGARLLRRAGIPIVETWDLPDAPIDAVAGFSNYAAGAAVARYLIEQGRENLAFIGGDDPRATRRWMGFNDAALEAGANAHVGWFWSATLRAVSPHWQSYLVSMPCLQPTTRMPSVSCPAFEWPDCCVSVRPRRSPSPSSASAIWKWAGLSRRV
jgi:LacI family transcriptional regulator, gluconate utilization system Gnt-I transcriptional repressor